MKSILYDLRQAFLHAWWKFRRMLHKPLGVCGYTHFVQIGKQRGQEFYRSFTCFHDAFLRLPNGQLRCHDHEVFPGNTFDTSDFQ